MAKRKRRDGGFRPRPVQVQIGDTLNIFPLLFPQPKDFLVCYNIQGGGRRRRVRADDIKGKTILIYMLPLREYDTPDGLPPRSPSLIAAYKDTDYDFPFEVVLVPVFRGLAARDRYRDLLSKMPPWPAVPLRNQVASDRLQSAFYRWQDPQPCWLLVDPAATVLLTSDYILHPDNVFDFYGIGEVVPLMHNILPLISMEFKKLFLSKYPWEKFNRDRAHLYRMFWKEDRMEKFNRDRAHLYDMFRKEDGTDNGGKRLNLKQLLGSHSPDFLLTNDGTKVPFSSLENKVIGLYLRNYTSSRLPRTELIKQTYEEVIRLGYDFEIVQINFHASPYFHWDPSYCCENIPWLTLPYVHSTCKRLVRILMLYGRAIYMNDHEKELDRDGLVIIDPHHEDFFERNGADIMCYLGIEAYPFTHRRLVDLCNRRKREEIKLQLIFGAHAALLRRRGESYDQVPVTRLWGKWVMLIFAKHSNYKSSKFVATIKSQYLEQQMNDVMEVVYISLDNDASTFDDCTAGMPWLVHPYSREFAHAWWSKIFTPYSDGDNDSDSDDDNDSDSDNYWEDGCALVAFHGNGEFMLDGDIDLKDYPLSYRDDMSDCIDDEIESLLLKYSGSDEE